MSLYNDLATVLTPYASKIKRNESDIGDIQDELSTINESLDTVQADLDDSAHVVNELSDYTYTAIGGKQRIAQHKFSLNNEYMNAYSVKYQIVWTANTKLYFKLIADANVVPSFILYVVDSEDTAKNLGSKLPNTEIEINVNYAIKAVYAYYGTKVTTSIEYLFYRNYASTLATKAELQTAESAIDSKYSGQIGNFKIVDGSTLEWVEDAYIRASDGVEISSVSWYSTPYISVFPETDITIALANSSSVVGVAWYDENKHFISGEALVYNHSYVGEMEVTSPENARYMRYSTSSITAATSYAIIKDNVLKLTKNVYNAIHVPDESASNVYWQYAMDKIICIGDSLTSGAYYDGDTYNGASIAQNYPYFMSRMLNTTVTNAGRSGLNVKEWYEEEYSKYTYTDYNTIIVWLGSNGGLRQDLPENPTEGQTRAYNNYVSYRQLLTSLQTANPNALIVMCKIYFCNYWVDISNEALEAIATEFSFPLVDLSDLNATNYPDLRYADVNQYHLIKCGNIMVASRIVDAMAKWFSESTKRCEFGLSPRVN